ncbi:hypothetical protein D3C84_680090 [compost metagenome]
MNQHAELVRAIVALTVAIFASQEAATQRRPQGRGQAQGFGHRQLFTLGGAFGKAVLDLDRSNRRKTTYLGQQVGTGDAPRGEVRQPGVMNLAGTDQIIEATQDLFHGRDAVAHVRPEQVDMLGLQPFQAFFDGAHHVLAAVASVGNAGRRCSPEGVFGGDDQAIPFCGNEFAEHGLGLPALIAIGGIDEIATGFQITIKNPSGFVTLGAMAPTGTEITRAQRQFGNTQAGFTTENFVMHGMTPEGWRQGLIDYPKHLFNMMLVI